MAELIACLDVHYAPDGCAAACVLLDGWGAALPSEELVERLPPAAAYVPGRLFDRELPPLLAVLQRVRGPLTCAIVDGYVYLSDQGRPGLGAHLWDALGRSTPVVGVAKTAFAGATHAVRVVRGGSARPLYVTSSGIEARLAAARIAAMAGPHRIPDALRRTDQLARRALCAT